MKKIILLNLLAPLLLLGESENDLNFYQHFTNDYCLNNPYSCKFDGSINSYSVNDFLSKLYTEVDLAFAKKGFTSVQFEYCKNNEC